MHRRRRNGRALLLALVTAGLAGSAASPAAADIGDGRLGGPPQLSPVTDATACPAGTVMTGATGTTRTPGGNLVVATITAQCIGPNGPTAGDTMGTPDPSDGSGSTACPAGQVAVGIEGREGDFLDQLVLRCRAADHTGPVTPSVGALGGGGGGADGPYDCPDGRALVGLSGETVFVPELVRYVQIVCEAGSPVQPPVTTAAPTPPAAIAQAVPPPVLGERMNVQKVSGQVLIAVPAGATGARRAGAGASQKGLRFIPLEQVRQIPVGSFLDTSKGIARITTARDSAGRTQSGDFGAGLFQVLQRRTPAARGLTDLVLKGSSFRRCGRSAARAQAAARSKRTIRRLRGNARGRFRTRGRYSAATVRGTVWTVTDRCDGTLTKVTRGSVVVRDIRRGRNVTVRAGKRTRGGGRGSYLARAG